MMAKIVKGSGGRGIVDYILDKKKQATLIDCQGVLFNDNSTIAKSFNRGLIHEWISLSDISHSASQSRICHA